MSKDVEDKVVSLTFENEKFKSKAAETIKVLQQMQDNLKKMGGSTAAADIKPTLGALDSLKAKLTGVSADGVEPAVGAIGRLKEKLQGIGSKSSFVDLSATTNAVETFQKKASTLGVPVVAGLNDVSEAAADVSLEPAGESASLATAKFIAFGAAAGAALYAIGAKAVQAGAQLVSAFTLDPIKDGFQEFETNMGAIQTILANTDKYGTKLGDVTKYLDQLNTYSDKTIYNFGEMVRNIGLFTNAGIRIEDATSDIKGFANVAAASGTNANDMARAATQLSQALSAGTIRAMDWFSLTNAGMGNSNMKDGLLQIADAMGTVDKAGLSNKEIMSDFKGSLEKGWLSADVMSNYLKIMAGDMDEAQMAALGLDKQQIETFKHQQQIAEDAATKVRTFTQLVSTVKESIGSGWSETFRNVVGDFNEGTTLFTGINKAISGMVSNSADARNKMLKTWHDFGGRNALIEGLVRSVAALRQVIDPIRLAFREMFPRTTAEGLLHLTDNFRNFTKGLMASKQTVDTIHRVFRGFFSLVKIGASVIWQLGKFVVSVFRDAFGGATSIGIMPFVASLGDVLTHVSSFLSEGGRLRNFFAALQGAVHHFLGPFKGVVQIFIALGKVAGALFGGVMRIAIDIFRTLFGETAKKGKGAADTVAGFFDAFTRGTIYAVYYINKFTSMIRSAFDTLHHLIGQVKDYRKAWKDLKEGFKAGMENPWASFKDNSIFGFFAKIGAQFAKIKTAFQFGKDNPWDPVKAQGFLGIMMKLGEAVGRVGEKFSGAWTKIKDFASGGAAIFDGIKQSITNADWFGMLKDVGQKLKDSFMNAIDAHSPSRMFATAAESIPQGIAEGIRSAWDSIKTAFSDLGEKLGEWWTSAKETFSNIFGDVEFDKVMQGGALVAILSFVNTLRLFRKDMSGLIESISGTFDELGGALSGLQRKLKAEALKELAIAIAILTASVLILTFVDPDKLKMALAAIAGGFAELAGTMKLMEGMSDDAKGMLAIGAAFLGLGIAITLLATSVKMLSKMSIGELATGLGAVGLLLGGLVLAIRLMPDGAQLAGIATSFVAIGASIAIMTVAVKIIGEMKLGDVSKGVVAIGFLAAILVIAAKKMTDALPGAGALVAAAGAILILAAAIKVIGEMKFGDIVKGTLAIGALMLMLVLSANAMTTALPGASALVIMAGAILIMAGALTVLGELSVAQILTGLGAILGLIVLLGVAAAVMAATGVVVAILGLGTAMSAVGVALALMGGAMLMAAMAIELFSRYGERGVETLIVVFEKLVQILPRLISAFVDSVIQMVVEFGERIPEVVAVFTTAFISILDAIDETAPRIFETLGILFSGIIQLVVDTAPQLIDAGMTLITSFLTSLTSHALEFGAAAALLISQFVLGIASNVLPLVTAAVTLITNFLNALVFQLPLIINAGVNLIVAFINGLTVAIPLIAGAVTSLIIALIGAIASHAVAIATAGTDAVIAFLGGMATNAVRIADAVTTTTVAVITSIVDGLFDAIVTVASRFVDIVCEFLDQMGAVVSEGGPRFGASLRGFAGDLVDGIAGGIEAALGDVDWLGMVEDAAGGLIGGFMEGLGINSPSKVFRKLARSIPEGIAMGIDDDTPRAVAAIGNMSTKIGNAFDADGVLSDASLLASALGDIENLNPVIAPVLDLTQVMEDARKITGMVDTINPAVSLGAANLISSTEDVRGNAPEEGSGGTVVNKTFVQNNYSPEALSANDIYRNTKSQFAMEREDLESA